MQLRDGRLFLSPSDLSDYLACPHLTQLELKAVRGEVVRPRVDNPQAELVKQKGDEHEAAFLARLRDEGRRITEIPFDGDFQAAGRATEDAIRGGAEVVYQACLVDPAGWRGFADFLIRTDSGTYEAWDTKLARHAKPAAVLQLTFYSYELERIQGVLPEHMHVVLGTGEIERFRPADFGAYFRRAQERLFVATQHKVETEPYPVAHCDLCDFKPLCDAWWDERDHLVRVAWIRRVQVERLRHEGVDTLTKLGDAPPQLVVPRMPEATLERLRDQAALQLHHRRTGRHFYHLLEPMDKVGFGLLPRPSAGDVFFDIEGDPFWEPARGLEYLFGLLWTEGVEERFRALWAHSREEERAALEQVIDLFHERLAADPVMHVYHYAAYETSALKRLAAHHGTREEELDELLRREVFVDLFTVVRQALRISHPSYSIKNVRQFFMAAGADLEGGEDAILLYERWLGERDDAILRAIEVYNEEDCVSNLRLRDWLLARRTEAEGQHGIAVPWRGPPAPGEPDAEAEAAREERARVCAALLESGEEWLILAAHLLGSHRREAKPAWWKFFDRLTRTPDELVDDSESIGALAPDGAKPEEDGSWKVHGLLFPVQQHRLGVRGRPVDPATERAGGEIIELDDAEGRLSLRRGPSLEDVPLPRALIPAGPLGTRVQQQALLRLGQSLLAGDGRFPALERILRRERPLGGALVQRHTLAGMERLVEEVEGSYLFIQGPPGSGKTWTGARLVVHLMGLGKRVGIASQSHKAIHNLLAEVEGVARERGIVFRGLKKATGGNEESYYEGDLVENETEAAAFAEADHELFAGTSFLFSRPELDGALDYLFIDEAGQISLADALAMGTSARTVVLLGDPVQLAQVTQGTHPDRSGLSVLEHLLDDRPTIPEDRGLFLEHSFRMHPDVCRFVSDAFYEGRLESAEVCAGRTTGLGTGLRFLPVEHEGNSTSSEEEAERIAEELARLRAAGTAEADVLVVAPYNAQVQALRERLPEAVRVGTVDKFQGQEAPVVFFSMASSSAGDAPRGIDFLMSRNRLNVAVSRAQCLAYLVCSPRLLEADCRTVEQMRLANALCRFVELARQP